MEIICGQQSSGVECSHRLVAVTNIILTPYYLKSKRFNG